MGLGVKYRMKIGSIARVLSIAFLLVVTYLLPAQAAIFGGYSEYYVPGREEQMFNVFSALATDEGAAISSVPGMRTVISITATGDDTTVYYDHWEDGYEFDPADPDNTNDLRQVLDAGEVLELVGANIPCAPRGTATFFDGGDRLYVAGTSVTVSRTSWPEDSGPNLAISWELFPIKPFLTDYTIPVGEDLALPANGNYDDFERTYVLVQSVSDNNVVQIDDPLTGAVDVVTTLNKGDTTELFNINAGTQIKGQQPVQVHFIVGRVGGGFNAYEARGFNAMPDSMWDNEYLSSVSSQGSGSDVDLYLYNPHTAQIIVEWADTGGSGSFTIPAKSTVSYQDGTGRFVPAGSGVYLRSDNIFWGIGSSDTESRTYDWGYSLVPRDFLTDEYFLSWAPGTSDAVPADNGSPAYVTAVFDETVVFVDYSPTDGIVDVQYNLNQLDSQKIFDPDNVNTAMHIWATGPLAVAWGQDADAAGTSNPYLDLGTANLPMPKEWIDLTLGIEKTADPTVLPPVAGSETEFTLVINTFDFPVSGIVVKDLLPPGFSFKNNSTRITFPDSTQKIGAAANPAIVGQEITWDNTVLNGLNMTANETLTIVFEAVTDGSVTVNTYSNTAQASGTRLAGSQVFSPFDSVALYVTALTIDKDTSTGSISAGTTASYTIRVDNISDQNATNVSVTDTLASADFSYAAADATITFYNSSGGVISSTTDTNDGAWGGVWTLGPGEYVIVSFDVDVAADAPPSSYDSNAAAGFTWDGSTDSIDDKGEVEQDPGTPHDEDPEEDEDVIVNSLLINKTTSTPVVAAGGSADYRIFIENFGTGAATGVDITDQLPDGFTYDGVTGSTYTEISAPREVGWGEPTDLDTNLQWGPWTINSGGSVTIDFTVNVPAGAPPATYDNSAIADSNETGLIDDAGTGIIADAHTPTTDTEDDEDVTVQNAVLQIDMDSVTKYAVADGVSDGTARYEIKVLNVGSSGAQNINITSTLPTDFTNDLSSDATITHYNSSGGVVATTTVTNDGNWTTPGAWVIGTDEYVIVVFDAVVDMNTAPGVYDSDANATGIDDDGTIAYDDDTIPLEDPEPDEDVEVLATPMADLGITKSHATDFDPLTTNTYTIEVTNNGPSADTATITVTDTLPTGLIYDSHSGPWTLTTTLPSQTLQFDYTGGTLLAGSAATLTLLVTVDTATAPNTVTNQVAVASPTADFIPGNDTAEDITVIAMPDLSTSTKTVLDLNGGDPEPGDLIRYTIQLNETAGLAANGVSVTDTIDADFDRTSFNLTTNPGNPLGGGSTYDSGTGLLTLTGINVAAGGSAQIVFEVAIQGTASQGTLLSNSADINNPDGRNESISAPDLIVQASQIPAQGKKPLYFYEDQTLSRTASVPPQNFVAVPSGSNRTWTLTPAGASDITIDAAATEVPVTLIVVDGYDPAWGGTTAFDITLTLSYAGAGAPIGTYTINGLVLGNVNLDAQIYNIPITGTRTIPAGSAITLDIAPVNAEFGDDLDVYPEAIVDIANDVPDAGAVQHWSLVDLDAETVINVDSVKFYDAAYPGGSEITTALPGTTVWVRADISDPFGSYDISTATIDIINPEGTLTVDDAVMTEVFDSGTVNKLYEYTYTIPLGGPVDNWTASVTGVEGAEGDVTHTGVGVITVTTVSGADLSIIKSHTGTFFKNNNGNFTLNVTNGGPQDQTADIVVRDTIPTGLTYVSSSGSGWSVNTAALPDVVWTYPASVLTPVVAGTNLPPITLTVNVDATAPLSIQNTATVDAGVDENNPSNNTSTDTVYIVERDVVKTVDVGSPYYSGDSTGDKMTYTVTVSNNGTGPIDNLVVSDPVPAGTTYVPGSSMVTAPAQVFRVTEYYVTGGFTGTSYDLILNQDLAQNYFVIAQGSDGDGATRGPDENYIALSGDPLGTGDLVDTDPVDDNGTILRFVRNGNVNGWEGVITVVESLRDHSGSGFLLRDVARVAHTGTATSGTDTVTNGWFSLAQAMLIGGFNGAGGDVNNGGAANHNSAHVRIWPSGTDTINWSRNAGGVTLRTATSTVMAIEWGTDWTVQRVRVQGTSGANGAATAAAYTTAPISGVNRANTWVWGTGHTNDNGIGDAGEGVLITLGDDYGVADPPNTVETQVAIGIEYSQALDFEVYALTHADLAVDYRFKTDGDTNSTTYSQTVDSATGNRMALITNGSNGTGTAYPRPIWSARYIANDTVQLERRYNGQNWPAWVQGIDFSGIISTAPTPGGDPPNLVTAADAYSLQPGQSMVVTFEVTIDNATIPMSITNTASVTSDQTTEPSVASVITEVRTIGVPNFTDELGNPVASIDVSAGEPVYLQVADKDRNEDPTEIETVTATVTNPDTSDSVVVTLYETGPDTGVFVNALEVTDPASNINPSAIDTVTVTVVDSVTRASQVITLYETGVNTGIFANDADGRRFGELPLVSCADPEINCCSALPDGCGTVTPPTAAETLYVEGGTTPQLQLDYADPADPGRDNASAQVFIATQVVLSDFGACRQADQSIVYWETASEVGTAAFNLLRLDTTTGDYELVNDRPVPSLLGHPQGGIYRLADPDVDEGDRVTYQLEEIESRGDLNRYGPFTVTVGTAPAKVAGLGAMTADFHRDAHAPNGLPQPVARTLAASRSLAAPSPGDALKISIAAKGFYYLSAVQIAGLLTGMTEADVISAIGQGNLALTRNGSLVPYLPAAANAGLYFYGTGSDSLYTASNYYWLRPGTGLLMEPGDAEGDVTGTGGVDAPDVAAALKTVAGVIVPGVRPDYTASGADVNGDDRAGLPEALYGLQALAGVRTPVDNSGALQPSATIQSFRDTLHMEQDLISLTDFFNDPAADYWIWGILNAGVGGSDIFAGPIFLPGWDGQGPLDLTVRLFGGDNSAALEDHHVVAAVNGIPVGEARWDGVSAYTLEITDIDPATVGLTNSGADLFSLQAVLDAGVAHSTVAVDSVTVTYPRAMVAFADQLALLGDNHAEVTVSGFSSTGIQVLDVGDPDRPRLVTTTLVDGSVGNYRATFAPFTATSPYYAVVPNTAIVPPVVTAVNDTDLRDTGNAYDYLVIAPSAFTTQAQELVDHRVSQGLTGRVVAWNEIVDGFNNGIPAPEAVREFLRYAYANWAQAPQYVVLAGNGTFDYKNIRGFGDNQIPALLTGTPDGLFASDQLLADVSGNDGVPDMALGRLPATSAAELTAMVNQIKAFESGSGPWRQRALMVAGSPEYAGETSDFKADSAGVADRLPPGFDIGTAYQDDGGTNVDVVGQLNAGTLLFNYIGHGGYDRLAGAGLLTLADLPSLTNAGERPLLAALTCIVGNFALPGIDTLGEALVKWPAGGAIAVWAPTGLSVNAKAVWLNEEFADQMTSAVGTDTRLGDLILNALRDYYLNSGDKFLVGLYSLLGDPALIMPLADLDTGPG